MKELTATDVEIIWTGMRINFLETELRENRDRLTNKELSDGARKIKQQNLRSMIKRYNRLCRKSWKVDEYRAYEEMEIQRRIDEERERRSREYDIEDYYNSMWLEAYDVYSDEQMEKEFED